jgi:RNA polymerase sigma factor (sigma-70 family)
MAVPLDNTFIQQLNQNLGIAHKVCRIYFYDADTQQDVLQEMMYQLCRGYARFDGRSKFSTWMYRVCLNTALTYRRNSDRWKNESLSREHYQIPEHPSANQEESIAMLFAAIEKLSAVNKAIALLYLEDMSYDEIASITGLSKSNVSVRLVRIKKELESQLKKNNNSSRYENT